MRNRWAILAVLVVVRIAMGFQFQSVASVGALLVSELGLSNAEVGTLAGLYLLPGAVLAIPLGLLGSRFQDKAMIGLGVLLMAVGGLLSSLTEDFAGIATGRILAGLGGVLQGIFVVKTISDWFEGREVATAMGIMLSGWPVGIALALVSLGPLSESGGWAVTMHATSILCALALVQFVVLYRPAPQVEPHTKMALSWPPAREALQVAAGGGVWTIYNIAYIAFLTFGPVLFVERGMSVIEAGVAVSASSWASMIAVPLGGYLADRMGRPRLVVAAGCVMETTPNIVILAPILKPLADNIGMNEIQFCIMMITALGVGFITPPLGLNLFVVSGITGESILKIAARAVPFVLGMFVVVLFIAYVPAISTTLLPEIYQ